MAYIFMHILTCLRYKAAMRGIEVPDNSKVTEEQKHIQVPTLLVVAEQDYITRADLQTQETVKWIKQLEVASLSSGHWPQLELPDKLNQLLDTFVNTL